MNFFGGIPNPVLIIKELKKDYPSLNKYENTGRPFHTLKESKNIKNYEIYPFFTGHLPIYITSIDLFLISQFWEEALNHLETIAKKNYIFLIEFVKVIHIILL